MYILGGEPLMEYREWLVKFGARLRAERERQKLTRIALANKIDTKQDYIAQIERGDKSPSMNTLRRILSALDVSADSLLFGVNTEKDASMEGLLEDLEAYLKRRDVEEVRALCEVVKLLSSHLNLVHRK